MNFEALVEALRDPKAYRPPPPSVEVLPTHISVLFLAGDRVYKVKRPVTFPFLDYSTLERRKRFCEEEVRLNRRLAPGVYLGVVPVTLGVGGGARIGGEGEAVEYAVEMVRLPAERMLDRLLDRGEIGHAFLDELAGILARFHAAAPRADAHGAPDAVRRIVEENLERARPVLPAPIRERLLAWCRAFLAVRRDLFERRVREGRIRDGHGDLHAGNVCVAPEGVAIYDCIEFAPHLRCGDVAADVAFLAMDLDLRGFRRYARHFVGRYAELCGDRDLASVVPFYKCHRACVRGTVGFLRGAPGEAARYFQLAASYTLPSSLVLLCGLPGTGKSTLARHLAKPLDAALRRSDVTRKRLFGVPAGERGGEGLYSAEATERTYAALLDDSRRRLQLGRTVVVDASFPTAALRARFREMAREEGAPCVLVRVVADEALVLERLRRRALGPREVSDADEAVYRGAKERFEPPSEPHVEAPAARPPEETAMAVISALCAAAKPPVAADGGEPHTPSR